MKEIIYKEDAIHAIERMKGMARSDKVISKESAIYALKGLPPAKPQRMKAKWIKNPEYIGDDISGFIDNHYLCSNCKKEANINPWGFYVLSDFCPNCGADMRGEQDEPEK